MIYKTNIFEKILKKELPAEIIYENEWVMIIKDKFPIADIHWLVLPKNSYVDLKDFLNNAENFEKLNFFDGINFCLNKLPHAKVSFNVGKNAGQEIFHLHAHILSNKINDEEIKND